MRILFVITELDEGGAEHALGRVAACLHEAGHTVAVTALDPAEGAVAARLRAAGIPVHGLGVRGALQAPRLAGLRRVVNRFRPDVVNSWLFHANLAARLFVPRSVPIAASLRVVEPRRLHGLVERWTRGRVCRFLCVSQAVARFAETRIRARPQQCCVIENGVDFEAYAAARTAVRSSERLVGLTVARLTAQKGHGILLRALATAAAGLGPWEWHFVGAEPEPELAAQLRALAAGLGIDGHLHWHGSLSREELCGFYAQANIFALPSRWEGQPNVVLEALAAGLPVMAARTDGVDDLLAQEPECLALVAPNSVNAWSSRLQEVWTDTAGRAARVEAGLRLAAARSWADVAARHLDCYRRCLAATGHECGPGSQQIATGP